MHIAALTTVADETQTMLHNGLAQGSHQWTVGHRGTAVRVVPHSRFSANACPGTAGVEKLHSISWPAPQFRVVSRKLPVGGTRGGICQFGHIDRPLHRVLRSTACPM